MQRPTGGRVSSSPTKRNFPLQGFCKDRVRRPKWAVEKVSAVPTTPNLTPETRPRWRPLSASPSADLAIAARTGNPDAAGELFRRTHGRARRVARSYCREADADDAAAEGLCRALRCLDQLRDPAKVESWMLRCVVRCALDWSRKEVRLQPSAEIEVLTGRSLPPAESAAEAAISVLERRSMALAWRQLPPEPRLLLYLRYDAGMSVSHIASALGRPAGTIRRQCVEARRAAGQRFLGQHLWPAEGMCAQVSEVLCQEAYRLPSYRAQREVAMHLRNCQRCRDRRAEVAAILSELGYTPPGDP